MKTDAQKILKAKYPGDIFSNNSSTIRTEYFSLCKEWHPDINGNSDESKEVTIKINDLYQQGLVLIENGTWEASDLKVFSDKNGKPHAFKIITSLVFELGTQYIGNDIILYVMDISYKDFYNNYLDTVKNFKYANSEMRKEFERYLPKINGFFETKDNQFIIVVHKTPDLLILSDVLNYYKNIIPDRHVAWIMSRLYNLACFIDYNGLSHNGISTNNILISPSLHSCAILGGWWYATKKEAPMRGMSIETYKLLPPIMQENHLGNIVTDLESIRYLGRILLGENNGTKIRYDKNLPTKLIDWFLSGSSDSAFEEFERWNIVLTNSYGKRQFVEMKLSSNDIYSEKEN